MVNHNPSKGRVQEVTSSLPIPNEDLGRPNQPFRCFENALWKVRSAFPNLRLGSMKFEHLHFANVWRTFVRLGRIMINIFVEMFKMEIVEQKGTSCRRLLCMGFPTQNLAFVVIDFSYLLFLTCFDRGLKVRLFCSPQCCQSELEMTHNMMIAWRCVSWNQLVSSTESQDDDSTVTVSVELTRWW